MIKSACPAENPETVWNTLQAYQKTINFARDQISQGQLLAGKSMIDSTLKHLQRQAMHAVSQFQDKRSSIIRTAKDILQELQEQRKRRLKKKLSVSDESDGVAVLE